MPDLKHILMSKWHLIQNQPLLRKIFKNPPLISYRKGRSLNFLSWPIGVVFGLSAPFNIIKKIFMQKYKIEKKCEEIASFEQALSSIKPKK